jgi:CubicO group peptidase (beta-lactamase class C family)
MGGIAGHAGLFGTAAAVATLGQAWLETLDGLSHLLPKSLAQEAICPQAEAGMVRRGLGWALWSPDLDSAGHPLSHNAFGHTGFTGTSLYIDPERQLVIACLTNDVYYGREKRGILKFRLALHELVVSLP